MYAVSQQFLDSIRGPHRIAVLIESTATPLVEASWVPFDYPVSSGSVRIERGSDARRTLNLTVVQPKPTVPMAEDFSAVLTTGTHIWSGAIDGELPDESQIDPHGSFLRVWRGIRMPGITEYACLGVFRIYETTDDGKAVQLTGYSLDRDVKDARFITPWWQPQGVTLSSAIQSMLTDANIQANFSFVSSGLWDPTITWGAIFEKDRLGAVNEFAKAAGGEFFADADGTLVVKKPGEVTDTPVWTVDSGAQGVLVSYQKKRTREGTYNGVVVSNETLGAVAGEDTPTPIRVFVFDNDRNSPTYWFGPFGKVPRFYTSQFITTTAQALAAGRSILAQEKGLGKTISFNVVPNPALDVDDVVTVVYADGTSEAHLIDSLSIDLSVSGSMSASTRAIEIPTE